VVWGEASGLPEAFLFHCLSKMKKNPISPQQLVMVVIPLSVLISTTSLTGMYVNNFYSQETENWYLQAFGQDIFDLFIIVPLLLVAAVLTYKKHKIGQPLLGGILIYLVYTFTIFCFSVHFNFLFIPYCAILGLSFYALIILLYSIAREPTVIRYQSEMLINVTGIYFLSISLVFGLLWLSEIIPSTIKGEIPPTLAEAGLFTNPVYVLDLAIVLPGIFLVGIFLMRKRPAGLILAPVVLTFLILMDLTIAFLTVMMVQTGISESMVVAIVMLILALVSLVLLMRFLKTTEVNVPIKKIHKALTT
jgi:hypothetical protein